MEVITAKSAGFCFGVKRAMDKVKEQINISANKNIYTYGPIIHNEEVVKNLEARGVIAVRNDDELASIPSDQNNVMIIRSHGVPKATQDMLIDKGFEVVDATCPFVKRIHNTVLDESKKGKTIIIIGNRNHPEVEGIMGWCISDPIVIESLDEVDEIKLERDKQYCVVAQTTFNHNKFKDIVEKITSLGYDVSVVDTICNATEERQAEAKEIASKADAMIVIGGSTSSNTQKLYEICSRECKNTQYIQTKDDLDTDSFRTLSRVGITAGASTPNKIIEEVQKYVRIIF